MTNAHYNSKLHIVFTLPARLYNRAIDTIDEFTIREGLVL